jgi:hypothetical protein
MTNLMYNFLNIFIESCTCTCFEKYLAHLQEVKLFNTASGIVTLKTIELSKITII